MARRSNDRVIDDAAHAIRAYRDGGGMDTSLLREAAGLIVELRSRFTRKDGGADWSARTQGYRDAIKDVYTRAGLAPDDFHPMTRRLGYHVRAVLDERVPAEELEAAGFRDVAPAVQQNLKRATDAALAATVAPKVTAAVLIVQANNLLQRADEDGTLAEMTAKERAVCKVALAAINKHAEALTTRLSA